jgi:hypothetical protein
VAEAETEEQARLMDDDLRQLRAARLASARSAGRAVRSLSLWRSRVVAASVAALSIAACGAFPERTEVPHDWVITGLDDRSLNLVVAVGSTDCDRLDRVEVEETATTVTLTAVVVRSSGGFGCDADHYNETVTVQLETALGTRSLAGCAPGPEGLQSLFGEVRANDGSGPNDCAAIASDRVG